MRNLILKFIVFILVVFCYTSSTAYASTLNVITDVQTVKTGGLFTASIKLDSQSNPVNTIEGDLAYNTNLLVLEKVNIGSSFVSFWVEKPSVGKTGIIHFSGIVPGGVSISGGEVFSAVFRAYGKGSASLVLQNINLFLNDGQGTKDKTTVKDLTINISEGVKGDYESLNSSDKQIPEKFSISRIRDNSIFDNRYFIVFSAQDKGSGIDHYEICEFTEKNCLTGESPFLLKHQTPFYRIIVKAYDTDGNVREVVATSPLWILVIVFALLIILSIKYYKNRRFVVRNKV